MKENGPVLVQLFEARMIQNDADTYVYRVLFDTNSDSSFGDISG